MQLLEKRVNTPCTSVPSIGWYANVKDDTGWNFVRGVWYPITKTCYTLTDTIMLWTCNTAAVFSTEYISTKSCALLPRQPVLTPCHFTQRSRNARNVCNYTLNDVAPHPRSESSATPLWEPEISQHESKWSKMILSLHCFAREQNSLNLREETVKEFKSDKSTGPDRI